MRGRLRAASLRATSTGGCSAAPLQHVAEAGAH